MENEVIHDNPEDGTVEGFADSLLADDAEEPTTNEGAAELAASLIDEPEGQPQDAEPEQGKEDPKAEEESEESDEDSDAEDGDETEDHYLVKVDGEEVEVPVSELINGYSRQADYTRKTEELANQRRELDRTLEQKAFELRNHIERQYLDRLEQFVGQPAQPPDWNVEYAKVQNGDISLEDFTEAKLKWDSYLQQQERTQRELVQRRQAQHQQMEEARTDWLRGEYEKLQRREEFATPERAKETFTKILELGDRYGFSEDEVNSVGDSRFMALLADHLNLVQQVSKATKVKDAQKVIAEKKVINKPKVIRPGSRQSAKELSKSKESAAERKLSQERSPRALADFLTS